MWSSKTAHGDVATSSPRPQGALPAPLPAFRTVDGEGTKGLWNKIPEPGM